LGKKKDTLDERYVFGGLEREVFLKFSQKLKEEEREIEANLEKVFGP
jgi:hypothetical protein